MCIFCAYGYLYLHINCISLHILLHINAYYYLSKLISAYFMHVLTYLLLISCLFNHIINAYFYIFLHILAFGCITNAYACICLHICTYSHIANEAFNISNMQNKHQNTKICNKYTNYAKSYHGATGSDTTSVASRMSLTPGSSSLE